MPSQEDYLDQLLKGITGEAEEPAETDNAQNPSGETAEDDFDMSEIEELLRAVETETGADSPDAKEKGADSPGAKEADADLPGTKETGADEAEDLMSMLEKAGEDSDLQDIHEMLRRADNNEAVDENLIAMLQELPEDEGEAGASGMPEDLAEQEEGELTARQRKALEKKRLKAEKAEAKKAAKEAKKAAKEAKKAQKQAGKPEKGTAGGEMPDAEPAEKGKAGGEIPDAEPAENEPMGEELPAAVEAQEEPVAVDLEMGDLLFDLGGETETDVESAGDGRGEEPEQGGKEKKSLFAKILDFLTEEDEEEEQTRRGTEDIPLSDENRQVLEEMDQEKPGKKSKKGKKPKKEKKGKKAVGGNGMDEDEEAGDGGNDKKGKKAKKPKKEKAPKEKVYVDPKDRLSLKKLLPIILVGVSLLFVIMILINFGGDFVVKREARKAFYEEDYETCYQELYGKKLNESEQVMFGKSESILRIRLWMREYEMFADEGAEVEALDVLIRSVNDYAKLYEYAGKWNAEDDVSAVYSRILDILQDKYGLTEAQALEIAAEPDDVEYTRLVTAVAGGEAYGLLEDGAAQDRVKLPDMLPEEQHFPENNGGR